MSNWRPRPKRSWRRPHPRSGHPAITDATDFDERDANHNFDYDYEAYGEVKRNLGRLVELRELGSDEGLMTEDIEECLAVVLHAVKKCDLPPDEVMAWCARMTESDRVGFICDREPDALRKPFEALRRP